MKVCPVMREEKVKLSDKERDGGTDATYDGISHWPGP
jgi:hypothetical protein